MRPADFQNYDYYCQQQDSSQLNSSSEKQVSNYVQMGGHCSLVPAFANLNPAEAIDVGSHLESDLKE